MPVTMVFTDHRRDDSPPRCIRDKAEEALYVGLIDTCFDGMVISGAHSTPIDAALALRPPRRVIYPDKPRHRYATPEAQNGRSH